MTLSAVGPTSHSYISQRLRLHYVDWGNRGAPSILLVHGGRDHCRSWDWVAEALRHDYHVLAVDLRGHGDSAWAIGSSYGLVDFIYDLEQLIRQEELAPATIIAHSMGGAVSLMYAGTYPATLAKLVAVEGLVMTPEFLSRYTSKPPYERISLWVDQLHQLSSRQPRRYKSIEEALSRMQAENPRLTLEQARHLTVHGVTQNEDSSYSWKFDNYVRARWPITFAADEARVLLSRVTCPTLLIGGDESWMGDPAKNGAIDLLPHAESIMLKGAGHWPHHDKLDEFLAAVRPFIARKS